MLSSDNGELTLDTGGLVTQDLTERERSNSFGFNGSFDSSGSGLGFGNSTDTGGSNFGVTGVGGNYSTSALDGTTSATISQGTVTIRDMDENEAADLLASINRDTDNVTTITRDTSFRTGELFLDVGAAMEFTDNTAKIRMLNKAYNIQRDAERQGYNEEFTALSLIENAVTRGRGLDDLDVEERAEAVKAITQTALNSAGLADSPEAQAALNELSDSGTLEQITNMLINPESDFDNLVIVVDGVGEFVFDTPEGEEVFTVTVTSTDPLTGEERVEVRVYEHSEDTLPQGNDEIVTTATRNGYVQEESISAKALQKANAVNDFINTVAETDAVKAGLLVFAAKVAINSSPAKLGFNIAFDKLAGKAKDTIAENGADHVTAWAYGSNSDDIKGAVAACEAGGSTASCNISDARDGARAGIGWIIGGAGAVSGIGLIKKGLSKKRAARNNQEQPDWDNPQTRTDSEAGDPGIDGYSRGSLSGDDARDWYNDQVDRIPSLVDKGAPLEVQAKQAWELRNQFKADSRSLMNDRDAATRFYDTNPLPTWDQQIARSREVLKDDLDIPNPTMEQIYQRIIGTSTTTNADYNARYGRGSKKGD